MDDKVCNSPKENNSLDKDVNGENHAESSTTPQIQLEHSTKLQVARVAVYVFYKILNIFYIPILIYRLFQKSKKCSIVTNDLLRIPATELAEKIRKKEISCESVVSSYIARIEEVNPLLNAVIESRFDEAIQDAKKVDRLVFSEEFSSNGDKMAEQYPLLGVPFTAKGSIAIKGLSYTSGMVPRKDLIAENDAELVQQARNAGAIPLLVSNLPELCVNWETTNKLKGTTNNPHDTSRSSGGSSGGEASLLGAGASLIGIGSDLAGSLRFPAHCCGVFSHKPTPGVVSYEGHYPGCPNEEIWETYFSMGPMTRYAGDLKTFLGVLAKPHRRESLKLNEKIDVRNIKIYYSLLEKNYWYTTKRHCAEAVQKTVDHFKNICDTPPQKIDPPLFQYAPDLAALLLLANLDEVDFIPDDTASLLAEIFRFVTFRSEHCFMTLCFAVFRKCCRTFLPVKTKKKLTEYMSMLRRDFENTLGKNGVFITPTAPFEAFRHGDALKMALSTGFLPLFNPLGFPVTNAPVGTTMDGLPLGIQIAGLPYSDKLTLAVAEEIERAFGGWIEP